jgi:hypothetical protein
MVSIKFWTSSAFFVPEVRFDQTAVPIFRVVKAGLMPGTFTGDDDKRNRKFLETSTLTGHVLLLLSLRQPTSSRISLLHL